MCILKGFPTALKSTDGVPVRHLVRERRHALRRRRGQRRQHLLPATDTYTAAAAQTDGRPAEVGLQRHQLEARLHPASRAEPRHAVHRARLPDRGQRRPTGLPWAPATDGLRNITGRVNRDGTVTIWAVTSTVSGSGDQGADPNKLVAITDQPGATAPGAGESFATIRTAGYGEVLRGVSFTPGTGAYGR